jgi:hypothetical protein
VRRSILSIFFTLVCPLFITGCAEYVNNFVITAPPAPVDVIYDDDCDGDIDCAITQPIIHQWIDLGYLKIWGMVSSAPSQLGAPTMKVFRHYYSHDSLFQIGAWTPSCAPHQSAEWNVDVVRSFDDGDVCTNYPNCAVVLRQSVESYVANGGKANGLAYVITGPLSCEEEFRNTPGDAISPLSGAQMEKQYLREFVVMNGLVQYGQEYNCAADPTSCNAFFANVTSKNGYPPVYVVPGNTGAMAVATQVPTTGLAMPNPTTVAFSASTTREAFDEDILSVEYAIFGGLGWNVSANSTNSVDPTNGTNRWSSRSPSGQYYLSTTAAPGSFEELLTYPTSRSSDSVPQAH